MATDKIMIGGIGTPEIKKLIKQLPEIGFNVNKNSLSNLESFAYKLYVEIDKETKVVKNLVIEIEK